VIHDSLNFGHCHLSLGVPNSGKWENIHTLDDLKRMPEFTPENPLRVVTGYQYVRRYTLHRTPESDVCLESEVGFRVGR
jgi:ATP phosphoribosyltransferase